MITTTLSEFIVLCLGAVLLLLASLWLGINIAAKWRDSRLNRWRRVCPICGEVFNDESGAEESTCPGCGRLVEHRTVLDI